MNCEAKKERILQLEQEIKELIEKTDCDKSSAELDYLREKEAEWRDLNDLSLDEKMTKERAERLVAFGATYAGHKFYIEDDCLAVIFKKFWKLSYSF